MSDVLIAFGSEIKAKGEGRFEGYLTRFGSEDDPDLDGEFFTKNTEFFVEDGAVLPLLYDHGLDPTLKRRKIGKATLKKDDVGLWVEIQLEKRDKYERAIEKLGMAGKLGLSSGAASHLIERVKRKNSTEIVEWGIAEASLTITPAEYRNAATPLKTYAATRAHKSVLVDAGEEEGRGDEETPALVVKSNSLASVLSRHIEDRVDSGNDKETIIKSLSREAGLDGEQVEGILSGEGQASIPNLKAFARVLEVSFDSLRSAKQRDYSRTIKGMFEEALADQTPSRWQLDSVYSDIIRKLAQTAQASNITGVKFDLEAKVKEATGEYMERLQSLAVAQINEYVESGSDEPFYLKAIIDLSEPLPVSGGLDLESHSLLAVSALKGVVARYRANHEARQREGNNQKAGRVLSQANRNRLSRMLEQIKGAVEDCQTLLDESQPMATDAEKRAALTEHLRRETRARQLGAV